jgi:hypothetical protein
MFPWRSMGGIMFYVSDLPDAISGARARPDQIEREDQDTLMPKSNGELTKGESRALRRSTAVIARRQVNGTPEEALAAVDASGVKHLLPEHMRTEVTERRMRGNLTDEYCIDVICDLVRQGFSLKAARMALGVSTGTWYCWRARNTHDLVTKFEHSERVKLDHFADASIEILEQLRRDRDDALRVFYQAQDEYRKLDEETRKTAQVPEYRGPSEFDLRLAESVVKEMNFHLNGRHPDFVNKTETTHRGTVGIAQNININVGKDDAEREYYRIIDAK